MKIERLGYDGYTLLSPIYSNMDICHAILESQLCLCTDCVNQNFVSNIASFNHNYLYIVEYLVKSFFPLKRFPKIQMMRQISSIKIPFVCYITQEGVNPPPSPPQGVQTEQIRKCNKVCMSCIQWMNEFSMISSTIY